MCAADVLKKDFAEALEKIDFGKPYDPLGKAFTRAAVIGQTWLCVKCLESDDDVREELDGAENYWKLHMETGDAQYKEMAQDELKHAGILIKKHYKNASEKEKEKLENYENKRQEMLSAISKEA